MFAKFEACDKISDNDRVVQEVVKDIPALYTNEKDPDKKGIMKDAAVGQCKESIAKWTDIMKKAGC